MKKLLILLVLAFLLISFVSASGMGKITAYVVVDNPPSEKTNTSSTDNGAKTETQAPPMPNNFQSGSNKTIPSTASDTAKGVLASKCEAENCTVIVKDIQVGNEAKKAYEVVEQKETKLFGFIKKNITITSYFDADTKELFLTKKPWWQVFAF
jgi:hypothetical protein